MPTRIEHDSLGPVEIDSGRLWGSQTQRALLHFDIGTERLPADMIRAYARIKRACAIVHGEAGRWTPNRQPPSSPSATNCWPAAGTTSFPSRSGTAAAARRST